jgi:uncharacterized protein
LSDAQTKALTTWKEVEKTLIPNREDPKANTAKMKSDYSTLASYLRLLAWPNMVKIFSFWTLRMAVAEFDLMEKVQPFKRV